MKERLKLPHSSEIELVRHYGGPVSHAALDPSCSTFRVPGLEGLIGFRVVGGCAVALGDPICAPEQREQLADAFAAHCASNGWSILYAAATSPWQAHARERGYGSIEFADLLMADPRHDPEAGPKARHLRQNLNHIRRLGVAVREYPGETAPDAQREAEAEAACERWLASRRGPQMYLGRPRLFADRPGRRWFIAERAGEVIGVLSLLRAGGSECRRLINLVFSTLGAPSHTSELLVVSALRALREEGVDCVGLGIGPRRELGRIEGFGGGSEFLARQLYRWAAGMMHLHGKTVFWEKYGVTRREALYLLFQPPRLGIRELVALFRTFHFSVM